MGDSLATSLNPLLEEFNKEVSVQLNLTSPLNIFNWANSDEGIHRTLEKVKRVPKLPPLVIYYAGADLMTEEIIPYGEASLDTILSNLNRLKDPKIQTLLQIFPEATHFLFDEYPKKKLLLDSMTLTEKEMLPPEKVQKLKEIRYLLFELQLEELILRVKRNGSHLILITPPINLEALPLRICENTSSDKIMSLQDYIFNLIQEGQFEEALKESLELKKLMPANALTSYLLGNIYMHLGQSKEGILAYEEASALDCNFWRADAVMVNIMRKMSNKYDIYLHDYHQNMAQIIGKNILFLDDFHPQSIFDEKMLKSLVSPIRNYLKI